MLAESNFPNPQPSIYETYHQVLGPIFSDALATEISSRIRLNEEVSILELAAGTGTLTDMVLAQLPPGATLLATDTDSRALEFNSQRNQNKRGVEFAELDAEHLQAPSGMFDAVLSNVGWPFFGDQSHALSEAFRVLNEEGLLMFTTWADRNMNPIGQITADLLRRTFLFDPPRYYEAPFSYSNPKTIQADLERAGFESIKIIPIEREATCVDSSTLCHALLYGTVVADQVMSRSTVSIEQIESTLRRLIEGRFGQAPVTFPISGYLCYAVKPAA